MTKVLRGTLPPPKTPKTKTKNYCPGCKWFKPYPDTGYRTEENDECTHSKNLIVTLIPNHLGGRIKREYPRCIDINKYGRCKLKQEYPKSWIRSFFKVLSGVFARIF